MNNGLVSHGDIELKEFKNQTLPFEILDLRRKVFKDETNYLSDSTLESQDDYNATTLALYLKGTDTVIATAQVMPAEESEFQRHCGADKSLLTSAVFLARGMVAPKFRNQKFFSLIIYLILRKARIMGRTSALLYVEPGDIPAAKIIGYKQNKYLFERKVKGKNGRDFSFVPVVADINEAMIRSYSHLSEELKLYAQRMMGQEAAETANLKLDYLMTNSFFTKIHNQKITKNHYIAILANMYQFVRMTTRILARAASLSEDKKLRNHFIEHMNGEIDHEVIIENDLKYLGVDLKHIINTMVPSIFTEQFMVIQESYLGYYENSIRYLSVPFVIEGLSARLSEQFIMDLEASIRSWGYENPKKATKFLAYHIIADGGDDGHWAHNIEIASHCLKDELTLQKFLNGIHLTVEALDKCYSSYVDFVDYEYLQPINSTKHLNKRIKSEFSIAQ